MSFKDDNNLVGTLNLSTSFLGPIYLKNLINSYDLELISIDNENVYEGEFRIESKKFPGSLIFQGSSNRCSDFIKGFHAHQILSGPCEVLDNHIFPKKIP